MIAKIFQDCIISCHFKRYNFPIIYDNQLELFEVYSICEDEYIQFLEFI